MMTQGQKGKQRRLLVFTLTSSVPSNMAASDLLGACQQLHSCEKPVAAFLGTQNKSPGEICSMLTYTKKRPQATEFMQMTTGSHGRNACIKIGKFA